MATVAAAVDPATVAMAAGAVAAAVAKTAAAKLKTRKWHGPVSAVLLEPVAPDGDVQATTVTSTTTRCAI